MDVYNSRHLHLRDPGQPVCIGLLQSPLKSAVFDTGTTLQFRSKLAKIRRRFPDRCPRVVFLIVVCFLSLA